MRLGSEVFENFYSRYRTALNSGGKQVILADYNWYSIPDRNNACWAIYDLMLGEHAISLANATNQLADYSSRLKAWGNVLADIDDDTAMEIGFEFVDPLVTVALNLPYSIKQRFIFAVTHLSHQANRITLGSKRSFFLSDRPRD